MTAPRSETQRAISALRGAELLLQYLEKTFVQHLSDVAAIRAAVDESIEALKRKGA